MKELSLHILDIAQNAINANASNIEIGITEETATNLLTIMITDNGYGMSKELIERCLNPFYTTKNKKTGLGIPLLKQHAEMANGKLEIRSTPQKGTCIQASFELNHIDRQPMGNITETFIGLIRANPEIDFNFTHTVNQNNYNVNTKEIKTELDGISMHSPEVLNFLKEMVAENLRKIKTD